jgi:hypothetical protein
MMSVNQIVAQIKLTEMWKAKNDSHYPLTVEQNSETEDGIGIRSMTRGDLIEFGSSTYSKKSFIGSSTRLWNIAHEEIKKCLVSPQHRKSSRPIVKLCQYNCSHLCTH